MCRKRNFSTLRVTPTPRFPSPNRSFTEDLISSLSFFERFFLNILGTPVIAHFPPPHRRCIFPGRASDATQSPVLQQ